MAALRNFNDLASWGNVENSLQSVNLTMPGGAIRALGLPIRVLHQMPVSREPDIAVWLVFLDRGNAHKDCPVTSGCLEDPWLYRPE